MQEIDVKTLLAESSYFLRKLKFNDPQNTVELERGNRQIFATTHNRFVFAPRFPNRIDNQCSSYNDDSGDIYSSITMALPWRERAIHQNWWAHLCALDIHDVVCMPLSDCDRPTTLSVASGRKFQSSWLSWSATFESAHPTLDASQISVSRLDGSNYLRKHKKYRVV